MHIELIEILKNSVLITGLVIIMMLIIEYFNIQSHGQWFSKIKDSKFKQVLLGAVLGLFPGCIGGFAAVSLYTHKLLSFGALLAMTIATVGDEAFFIMSVIPSTSLLLFGILFILAIIVGLIFDYLPVIKRKEVCPVDFEIHESDCIKHDCETHHHNTSFKVDSFKNIFTPSKTKIAIITGVSIFIMLLCSGSISHTHEHHDHSHEATEHIHTENCTHHNHTEHNINLVDVLHDSGANAIFLTLSIIALILIVVSNEHFVREHLWKHIIKEHLLTIFLWTFGALLLCHVAIQYLDIEHWINNNMIWVIIIAALIGIIPESGPHMVFVTLFAQGMIPFYVLLVNSIVQDGHSMLPLFAEDKMDFVRIKTINLVIGILAGIICMLFI